MSVEVYSYPDSRPSEKLDREVIVTAASELSSKQEADEDWADLATSAGEYAIEYREALEQGALLAVARDLGVGQWIGYGFLTRNSPHASEGILQAAFTLPEYRRQGTFTLVVSRLCEEAAQIGIRKIIGYTAPDNIAGRVLERAGFTVVREPSKEIGLGQVEKIL